MKAMGSYESKQYNNSSSNSNIGNSNRNKPSPSNQSHEQQTAKLGFSLSASALPNNYSDSCPKGPFSSSGSALDNNNKNCSSSICNGALSQQKRNTYFGTSSSTPNSNNVGITSVNESGGIGNNISESIIGDNINSNNLNLIDIMESKGWIEQTIHMINRSKTVDHGLNVSPNVSGYEAWYESNSNYLNLLNTGSRSGLSNSNSPEKGISAGNSNNSSNNSNDPRAGNNNSSLVVGKSVINNNFGKSDSVINSSSISSNSGGNKKGHFLGSGSGNNNNKGNMVGNGGGGENNNNKSTCGGGGSSTSTINTLNLGLLNNGVSPAVYPPYGAVGKSLFSAVRRRWISPNNNNEGGCGKKASSSGNSHILSNFNSDGVGSHSSSTLQEMDPEDIITAIEKTPGDVLIPPVHLPVLLDILIDLWDEDGLYD